jgi:hypothetical protein
MSKLTLVVKGRCTSDAITREFVERGLTGNLLHAGKDFCTYKTDMDNLEKVAGWFVAHGECLPGRGYADGTCLLYSIHDSRD